MKKILKLFIIVLIALTLTFAGCELIIPPTGNDENTPPPVVVVPPETDTPEEQPPHETPPEEQPPQETEFNDYGFPVITIVISEISITEDGKYTSMAEVGLYIYTYHKLPSNYATKSQFNRNAHTSENKLSVGGDKFYNREGLLPEAKGRTFTECDIDYTGGGRNSKRIVFSSDWLIFYTSDHYASYSILRFV